MSITDLQKQLEIIFQAAPGPHEIRVIGRYYQVSLDGQAIERVLESERGDLQAFSIGCPTTPQEALADIQGHFRDREPHNCYIVLNRVSDNFSLSFRKQKIGDTWTPKHTTILTKARDIQAVCSLAIDLDRKKTAIDEEGNKLCASDEELNSLDQVRTSVVEFLTEFSLQPSYQLCSGNGYQIVVFFQASHNDLDRAKSAVSTILEGLHSKFAEEADIDVKLKDPSRVVRLAGTWNRKPARIEVPDQGRKHRLATLLDASVPQVCNSFSGILALVEALRPLVEQANINTSTGEDKENAIIRGHKVQPQKLTGWRREVAEALSGREEEWCLSKGFYDFRDCGNYRRGFTPGSHSNPRGNFALCPDGYFFLFGDRQVSGYLQEYLIQIEGMDKDRAWEELAEYVEIVPHSACRECGIEIYWRDRQPFSDRDRKERHRCRQEAKQKEQNVTPGGEEQEAAPQQTTTATQQGNTSTTPERPIILQVLDRDSFSDWGEFSRVPGGLKTGWKTLDEYVQIWPVGLTTIGGRPSHGKTTFLLNLCRNMIGLYPDQLFPFFTYEEPAREIALKFLMCVSGYQFPHTAPHKNSWAFRDYLRVGYEGCSDVRKTRIDEAMGEISSWIANDRLRIIGCSYQVLQLVEAITALAQNYHVGAVFVDYLQKVKPSERTGTRQLELQRITETLQETAKKLNLPIILGAQLKRETTLKTMSMNDFREAGDIENETNTGLGLWNPVVGESEEDQMEALKHCTPTQTTLKVVILKNRNGAVGQKLTLKFQPPILRISDPADNSDHEDIRRRYGR